MGHLSKNTAINQTSYSVRHQTQFVIASNTHRRKSLTAISLAFKVYLCLLEGGNNNNSK